MNLTEFLEELSKTRNGWYMRGVDIRKPARQGRSPCPITAVCMRTKKAHFKSGDYPEAGERLGLSGNLADRIALASDGTEGPLRSKLLKAVGLK